MAATVMWPVMRNEDKVKVLTCRLPNAHEGLEARDRSRGGSGIAILKQLAERLKPLAVALRSMVSVLAKFLHICVRCTAVFHG